MMSTPSPRLSREEELAIWREQRKKKENQRLSRTPTIHGNISSGGSDVCSGGAIGVRRRSTIGSASMETLSAYKTPYRDRQSGGSKEEESPFLPPARLSSNVSCRKSRLPRRDMSTASSRLKQKSLSTRDQTTKTPKERLSYRSRKSLSAEIYLSNRPSSLLSKDPHKENSSGSLVSQIRSRAAKKRHNDGGDESSKLDSRATSYRTPLSYENSVATAQKTGSSRHPLDALHDNNNGLDSDGILDISISLPFEDVLSPLSTTSITPSPASTISSNETVNKGDGIVDAKHALSRRPMTPMSEVTTGTAANTKKDQQSLSSSDIMRNEQETPAASQEGPVAADVDANATPTPKLVPTAETRADGNELTANEHHIDNKKSAKFDFQGIDDDSDGLEERILERRKRRRDSTFLRLPTPEPCEERQSISPNPARSAFIRVERRQSAESLQQESPRDHESPSLFSDTSPPSTIEKSEIPPTPSDDDSSLSDTGINYHSHDITRVNDRAILEAIPETRVGDGDESVQQVPLDSIALESENRVLREEARTLRIANSTLEKKLHTLRQAYEERVTPFRDVFEDVSHSLRRATRYLHCHFH